MKVAFLGNMNNNNFAMMRYFRDLGFGAHLVLFTNDTHRGLEHFAPEMDTWDIEKWKPFIHRTNIENLEASITGSEFPLNILYFFRNIRLIIKNRNLKFVFKPVTKNEIRSIVIGYDAFIGSGLSGALLARIGKSLDIFYPCAAGIEFLGNADSLLNQSSSNPLKRYVYKKLAKAQEIAIKNVKKCTTGDLSLSKKSFEKIGVDFIPISVPMVYNREIIPADEYLDERIRTIKYEIESCDFSVFNHSRQLWVNTMGHSNWEIHTKHNEWLFKCFANFIKLRPDVNSKLFVVEYGQDVKASKELCAQLHIENYVKWLPLMSRKEIMVLISRCNIGVGEFYTNHGIIWGGTGWEILSVGKPLLQGFIFNDGEFSDVFGYPPPPMLPVTREEDILKHLLEICDNPEKGIIIGNDAKEWFDRYNGIGLAQRWYNLLVK